MAGGAGTLTQHADEGVGQQVAVLVGGVALVHGPAADLRVTEDDGVPGHLTVGVGRCRYRQEGAPRKMGREGRGRVGLGPRLPGRTEPSKSLFLNPSNGNRNPGQSYVAAGQLWFEF